MKRPTPCATCRSKCGISSGSHFTTLIKYAAIWVVVFVVAMAFFK